VVFRQHFAKRSMESQNQTWGFKFGDREVRVSATLCAFFGAVSAVLGLMFMLGVIHFR